MSSAFLVEYRENRVAVWIDQPRAARPSLLSFAQIGPYAAVLLGRLYYRNELARGLPSARSEAPRGDATSDAATLALRLYCQGGPAALPKLEGDYALVIWDGTVNRLIGARDPMGGYPLFWSRVHGGVALSTTLSPLLARLPHRELSLEFVAAFLMVSGQRNEGASECCAYQGVRRVSPGTVVGIDPVQGRIESCARWDWENRIVDPGTDDLTAVAERYRAVLRQAVQERLDGRVVAHFSGGMDSTSIGLLAREVLRADGGELPLHTLSLVYERLPVLARERRYLESALADGQDLVSHRLVADDLLDFDSFADPPPHDEPYMALWRLAMDRALVETAAGLDADTILTGLGADDLLDTQPYYLTDLLRQGQISQAWREAARWARVRNCSAWTVLGPFGFAHLLSPVWRRMTRTALGRSDPKRDGDWSVPPWIRPAFARRFDLSGLAADSFSPVCRPGTSTSVSVALAAISSMAGDVIRWAIAAPLGLAVAHPFQDPRVLCLGLGILDRLPAQPQPMKPVLAAAMRDLLPDELRTRRTKGHFNELYYLGLGKNLDLLDHLVATSSLDTLGIVDKSMLRASLEEASLATVNPRQLRPLNLILSFIRWWSLQEEWARRPWRAIRQIELTAGVAAGT